MDLFSNYEKNMTELNKQGRDYRIAWEVYPKLFKISIVKIIVNKFN